MVLGRLPSEITYSLVKVSISGVLCRSPAAGGSISLAQRGRLHTLDDRLEGGAPVQLTFDADRPQHALERNMDFSVCCDHAIVETNMVV